MTAPVQGRGFAVTDAAPGVGDLRDDLALTIHSTSDLNDNTRNQCRFGNFASWTLRLAPTPLGSLPAAAAGTLLPGGGAQVCFTLEYVGEGFFGDGGTLTTSAALAFDATGLE
ncbi:MAG: hypothetical protein IH609_11925 [Dehalococcoidia bacterium]|nr:hypothetical protein [Dehalococcoidia bacterium]